MRRTGTPTYRHGGPAFVRPPPGRRSQGAAQGRGTQMARTLRRALGAAEARNPDAPYNLASLQLILGDRAGAAESLQQALRIPSPSLIWLPTDPDVGRGAIRPGIRESRCG